MVARREGEITFEGKPERPILRFRDSEKKGKIPKEIFLLTTTTNMVNFDV